MNPEYPAHWPEDSHPSAPSASTPSSSETAAPAWASALALQVAHLTARLDAAQHEQQQQQATAEPTPLPHVIAAASGENGPVPGLPASTCPRESLPKLALFTGERKEYRLWALEAHTKLAVDGGVIGPLSVQFMYLYMRMEKKAQALVVAYVQSGGANGARDPAAFMAYMDSVFLDANAASRARDRLRSLRQKPNESFAVFFPRFEGLIFEAELGLADDPVKISYLEGAIHPTLRLAMIGAAQYRTYREYAAQLNLIGSRLDGMKYTPGAAWRPAGGSYYAGSADSMDWEPSTSTMVRGAAFQGRGRLSPEELESLKREGRCFRCRKRGHMSTACIEPREQQSGRPQAAAVEPRRNRPQVAIAEPRVAKLGSDEDEDAPSGKGPAY
jgi:hypothetical protein